MKNFKFNQIYIIESLTDSETHTGYKEYEDIKLMALKYPNLDVIYRDVCNLSEWNILMEDVYKNCGGEGNSPIFHLEIHGEKDGKGLVLKNCELVDLYHVGEQFRKINRITGCNLFLTLGVCKGLYLLFNMEFNKTMPFVGAIGSFDEINSHDIQCRYTRFYETLLNTLDIAKAYVDFIAENTGVDPKYRYIAADEMFYKNYKSYIDNACNEIALKKRAYESILSSNLYVNRVERRHLERKFIELEKQNREKYYQDCLDTFFMLKEFPENLVRFEVPTTLSGLRIKCDRLVTI